MNGVYYAPTGYGGIPLPLLRGHIDSAMIPTSGMDYITDHFQGIYMYIVFIFPGIGMECILCLVYSIVEYVYESIVSIVIYFIVYSVSVL